MRKFLSLIAAAATMAVISQSALAASAAAGQGFWGTVAYWIRQINWA